MLKIVALKYGESLFDEKYIFDGGREGEMLSISFVFYLIQTDDKNILVDVGCDDGAGFEMSIFRKPVEILQEYGMNTTDITDIIITHSHHDHIEAIHHYPRANIYIQKDEFETARKYLSDEQKKLYLFDEHFRINENIIVNKIGGHSKGSSVVEADNYILCGDECYYKKSLEEKICIGSFYDKKKNLSFVNKYSDKKFIPLLFHDPMIIPNKIGYMEVEQI